jgi:hypothetical protein
MTVLAIVKISFATRAAWDGAIAQMDQDITGLTAGGVVMMTLSIGLVTALAGFCIYRVLRERNPAEHHHTPLDIDTGDK